jgi:ABC-type uncharacterized transport system permease subunit
MTFAAVLLALALLQQPQPTPPQRPAEITISVDEYARLKTCEAQMKQKRSRLPHWAIVAGAVVAIVAIAKKKQ